MRWKPRQVLFCKIGFSHRLSLTGQGLVEGLCSQRVYIEVATATRVFISRSRAAVGTGVLIARSRAAVGTRVFIARSRVAVGIGVFIARNEVATATGWSQTPTVLR